MERKEGKSEVKSLYTKGCKMVHLVMVLTTDELISR